MTRTPLSWSKGQLVADVLNSQYAVFSRHLATKYEDIVMPEQHRHLANKCEDIVNLQGRRHIVSPRAQLVMYVADLADQIENAR